MLQTTDGTPAAKITWQAKGRRLIALVAGFAMLAAAGGAPFHSNGLHW